MIIEELIIKYGQKFFGLCPDSAMEIENGKKWTSYRALFLNEKTTELLAELSERFFLIINESLETDITLSID